MSNKINMKTVDGLKQFVAFKGYDSTTSYSLNDVVVSIQNNEVKIYQSLSDNNTSSLSDTTKWKEVSLGGSLGGGGEIGDMGFAPLGIDESLNLRRYLNGQVISQGLSPAFTAKVKAAIALHSSSGTTEANWQAEKALSKFGQVGKFVIDDVNNTIRLPAVVNSQGLLGLSGIGTLVNESLPNITGQFGSTSRFSLSDMQARTNGAFSYVNQGIPAASSTSSDFGGYVTFDASRSSTAYQDDAPVQQEAIQYPYYIQIATGVEEELPAIREYKINTPFFFGWSRYFENAPYNASLLASHGQYNASTLCPDLWTQLTGVELNTSLNVGDTIEISGKTYVKRGLPVVLSTGTITDYDFVVDNANSQFRLPLLNGEENLLSNRYTDSTLGPTGTPYTAPANGYFYLVCNGPTAYVYMLNKTLNQQSVEFGDCVDLAGGYYRISLQVRRNDVIEIFYDGSINFSRLEFIYAKGNGILYYYVGDVVQDASLINAGAVLNDVVNLKADKAGIDLSNVNNTNNVAASNLNSKGIRTVVETYKNGTSWYRIWSDGWIEQGGIANVGANSQYNGTFLKPFENANICFLATDNGTGLYVNSYGSQQGCGVSSNSAFFLRSATDYTVRYTWYACGALN